MSVDLTSEGTALREAAGVQQDVDSSSDSKDQKQRSVSPVAVDGIKTYASVVSFDAQPVNFYLRLGAIGTLSVSVNGNQKLLTLK